MKFSTTVLTFYSVALTVSSEKYYGIPNHQKKLVHLPTYKPILHKVPTYEVYNANAWTYDSKLEEVHSFDPHAYDEVLTYNEKRVYKPVYSPTEKEYESYKIHQDDVETFKTKKVDLKCVEKGFELVDTYKAKKVKKYTWKEFYNKVEVWEFIPDAEYKPKPQYPEPEPEYPEPEPEYPEPEPEYPEPEPEYPEPEPEYRRSTDYKSEYRPANYKPEYGKQNSVKGKWKKITIKIPEWKKVEIHVPEYEQHKKKVPTYKIVDKKLDTYEIVKEKAERYEPEYKTMKTYRPRRQKFYEYEEHKTKVQNCKPITKKVTKYHKKQVSVPTYKVKYSKAPTFTIVDELVPAYYTDFKKEKHYVKPTYRIDYDEVNYGDEY
eukprot:Pgem_evm1s12617